MSSLLWISFAVVFPYLCAAYAFNKTLAIHGAEAFTNPGGLRLPYGEVVMLLTVVAALAFVALIDAVLNGFQVMPIVFDEGVTI